MGWRAVERTRLTQPDLAGRRAPSVGFADTSPMKGEEEGRVDGEWAGDFIHDGPADEKKGFLKCARRLGLLW